MDAPRSLAFFLLTACPSESSTTLFRRFSPASVPAPSLLHPGKESEFPCTHGCTHLRSRSTVCPRGSLRLTCWSGRMKSACTAWPCTSAGRSISVLALDPLASVSRCVIYLTHGRDRASSVLLEPALSPPSRSGPLPHRARPWHHPSSPPAVCTMISTTAATNPTPRLLSLACDLRLLPTTSLVWNQLHAVSCPLSASSHAPSSLRSRPMLRKRLSGPSAPIIILHGQCFPFL